MYVCTSPLCLVPVEVRIGNIRFPGTNECFQSARTVKGIEPRPSARAISAL